MVYIFIKIHIKNNDLIQDKYLVHFEDHKGISNFIRGCKSDKALTNQIQMHFWTKNNDFIKIYVA